MELYLDAVSARAHSALVTFVYWMLIGYNAIDFCSYRLWILHFWVKHDIWMLGCFPRLRPVAA